MSIPLIRASKYFAWHVADLSDGAIPTRYDDPFPALCGERVRVVCFDDVRVLPEGFVCEECRKKQAGRDAMGADCDVGGNGT